MADYQLELRQVVDYPRCRIYREFMQTLIADRSIRTGGCSGLFYYVVLCSYEHGYWCSKSGSYHTLIPGAAQAWGLSVEGCTASEPQRILDALADGKLVVALMTKGHFTKSGHFIVLRGVQDEKILVADPASYRRSQKAWDLSIILNEASRRAGAGGPFWIIGL